MKRLLTLAVIAATAALSDAHAASEPSVAQRLGSVAASARWDSLSEPVRQRLALTVADTLATLTYATAEHCNDPYVARLVARGGPAEALVPGCGVRLPAESAAAAIAYLIHANETDDSDFRSELRASPPIFGAALASAQINRATGHAFLTSLAVGYAVQGAVAQPLGPLQPRWMTSGIWGAPGAAASSAVTARLDAPKAANAIALAATAAAGPFQYFFDQTEEKRLIIARTAFAGVEAARLASAGEGAAPSVFEGRAGLWANLDAAKAATINADQVVTVAAALDGVLYVYPKFFAASSSIIPFLEGLSPLVREGRLPASDIDFVQVEAEPRLARVLADKIVRFEPPKTAIGAKINLAFVMPLFLTRRSAGPQDFTPANLADPAILALAQRTRFQELPEGDGSRLVVVMKSGERVTVEPVRIDPTKPAPQADALRQEKFANLTARLSPSARATLRALADEVATVDDMNTWSSVVDKLLRPKR